MILASLFASFAATPDDTALRTLLGARAGREIPADLFCVARPELGEGHRPVAALGVQMKGVGCRLQAVVIEGELHDPARGLPVAAPDWGALDAKARGELALRWTLDVLLAFDQPSAGSVDAQAAGHVVRVPFLQRVPGPNAAAATDGEWVFDGDGRVTSASREPGAATTTKLYFKFLSSQGVTEQEVTAAMAERGGLLHACVHEAWLADHALETRPKIGWNLANGKADNVTIKGDAPDALVRCYANAIARLAFPPELKGRIDWQFAMLRSPLPKP